MLACLLARVSEVVTPAPVYLMGVSQADCLLSHNSSLD